MRFKALPVHSFEDVTLDLEQLQSILIPGTGYFSGVGKTTVTDADFGSTTPIVDGMMAVHYDTSFAKTYLSVRANGSWHVMAGPV